MATDFLSKWANTVALPSNDSRVGIKFMKKHISLVLGTPREIISDGGVHLINQLVMNLLSKYYIQHKFATTYHP